MAVAGGPQHPSAAASGRASRESSGMFHVKRARISPWRRRERVAEVGLLSAHGARAGTPPVVAVVGVPGVTGWWSRRTGGLTPGCTCAARFSETLRADVARARGAGDGLRWGHSRGPRHLPRMLATAQPTLTGRRRRRPGTWSPPAPLARVLSPSASRHAMSPARTPRVVGPRPPWAISSRRPTTQTAQQPHRCAEGRSPGPWSSRCNRYVGSADASGPWAPPRAGRDVMAVPQPASGDRPRMPGRSCRRRPACTGRTGTHRRSGGVGQAIVDPTWPVGPGRPRPEQCVGAPRGDPASGSLPM